MENEIAQLKTNTRQTLELINNISEENRNTIKKMNDSFIDFNADLLGKFRLSSKNMCKTKSSWKQGYICSAYSRISIEYGNVRTYRFLINSEGIEVQPVYSCVPVMKRNILTRSKPGLSSFLHSDSHRLLHHLKQHTEIYRI